MPSEPESIMHLIHDTLLSVNFNGKRLIDLRQLPFVEFYIYYRSRDLYDTSGHLAFPFFLLRLRAPDEISVISWVIAFCLR